MKKITTTLLLSAMFLFGGKNANAQLADGCIAPDFTATDINNNSWNLYDILDQGKTVFIDISATWCNPCWVYHNTGNLENLYNQYGPPGTDECMVFFIEGDGTTNTACLTSSVGCNSTTQGNWITGTPYPIIDNNQIADDFQINYFPTIYMITPDRICRENSQISTAQHYAAMTSKRIIAVTTPDGGLNFGCGTNANLASCTSVNMVVRLFNYSTVPLTSATITVTVDGNIQQTIPWTGSLDTYSNTDISITGVTGTPGAKTAVIAITGVNGGADSRSTNNSTNIPFTIYPTVGGPAPSENFSAAAFPPANWSVINGGNATYTWKRTTAGYNGVGSTRIQFYWISAGEVDALLLPVMDFSGYQSADVTFMRSHKRYSTSSSDKLMIKASTNCGTTWSAPYTKQGAALASVTGVTGNVEWVPAAATDWVADQASLTTLLGNSAVLMKFEGVSGYGNNLYIDDINVNLSVGINKVSDYVQFSVYPNPASEQLSVDISMKQSEKATVEILNTVGEVVLSQVSELTAGQSKIDFDIKNLTAGSYFVSVSTTEGKIVKPFMVQ